MFKCSKCGNDLNHIDCEFWKCELCILIIEIPTTKKWKNENNNNRFYEHIFKDRDNPVIRHEIGIKRESRENYFKFICGD